MIPQEKLKHEIKVLEDAYIIAWDSDETVEELGILIAKKRQKLEALKKPKFRDGTLGRWGHNGPGGRLGIVVYNESQESSAGEMTFEPLPIETILRHLAPDGATVWKYWGPDICIFVNDAGDMIGGGEQRHMYRIPAPYREDWQGIEGTL